MPHGQVSGGVRQHLPLIIADPRGAYDVIVIDGQVRPTLGVEEEFHVLDPATGDLVPAARQVLRRDQGDAGPELQRTTVETSTGIHRDLADLRADLLARRRELAEAAGSLGLAIASVGTVPTSGSGGSQVFPDRRYEWMAAEYRHLVDEQQVCACQVHVGVDDRDLAVRITRRIRAWLPVLLAMSASSPFFQGGDTGYASYRTVVVSRWPTVGPPPDFASAEEYDRTVATLIESGVISDAGMIYFDARLSARYPTVEIRVPDACPSVDDAVLLAALAGPAAGRQLAGGPVRPGRVPDRPGHAARGAGRRGGTGPVRPHPAGAGGHRRLADRARVGRGAAGPRPLRAPPTGRIRKRPFRGRHHRRPRRRDDGRLTKPSAPPAS